MARYWYSYISSSGTAPAIYAASNYAYTSAIPGSGGFCDQGAAKLCAIYAAGTQPSGTPPVSTITFISDRLKAYIGQTGAWRLPTTGPPYYVYRKPG